MTAGKKKPEEKKTDTPGSTRSLRDNAEEHLARSPKSSPELKEKSPGQLIHELQVHQIELETQAEELRRAHLALEESRDKYLSLYEFAPIGYLTLTDTALIAEVNLFGAALLGIERKKLLNARFRKFIAQKDSERWVQYFMDVLDQGEKQVCTLMLKRVDDSMFPARLEGVRASDSNGATIVRVTFSDISDIWQIEAVAESEKRLRSYIDNAPDGVFIADETGRYLEVNPAACLITGYKKEELLAMRIPDLLPPESLEASAKHFNEVITSGQGSGELQFRHKDGSLRYWSVDAVRLSPTRFIGFVKDITVRKQAEDSLRRVNQKLNVLSQLTRTELISQIFLLDGYVEMAKSYAAGQDRIIETLQKGEKAIRLLRGTIAYSKDYQDMGVTPPVWQNVKRTMLFGLSHLPISNINHSLETENLEVFADPLLEKACQRLFENSLAHGGHVSRIRVWHTVTPDGVNLFFEDDGIGIPVEMKEQIFLHDDTRTSVRGLFFIREILDITDISIRETGEMGKGARFEMAVPRGMWRITGDGA